MIDIQGGVSYEPERAPFRAYLNSHFRPLVLSYFTLKINLFIKNAVRRYQYSKRAPFRVVNLISHSLVLWPFDGIVFHKSATSTGSGAWAGAAVRRVSELTASLPLS